MSSRGEPGTRRPSRSHDSATNTAKAVGIIIVVLALGWLVLKESPHHLSSRNASQSSSATSVPPKGSSGSSTTTTAPAAAPASIKVLVLNGTKTAGSAAGLAKKLQAAGFNTLPAANATNQAIPNTAVYAVQAGNPAATAVGRALNLPPSAVQTSLPPNAPINPAMMTADAPTVVVIVGADANAATGGAASAGSSPPASSAGGSAAGAGSSGAGGAGAGGASAGGAGGAPAGSSGSGTAGTKK